MRGGPSMIKIRHWKMKKHHRRKWKKKMLHVLRARRRKKEKRKEKVMQEYEQAQRRLAEAYDAERTVDEHLSRAREAGWGIDIIAERRVKKS